MNLVATVKKFCTPARFYVYVSLFSMLLMVVQNVGNEGVFCVGSAQCAAPSLLAIFLGQALYIAFWTLVLQGLCKAGYEGLSWFVFLFPLVMFFVIIGAGMLAAGGSLAGQA